MDWEPLNLDLLVKKKKGLIEDKCLKMTIKNLPEGGQGQGVQVRKQEIQRPQQRIKKGRVAGGW